MKKFKTFAAVLAASMVLTLLPGVRITAEAAEPVTYSVKYISKDGGWYYVEGSEFEGSYSSVYYLREEKLKDGDHVVVYNDTDTRTALELGKARLGSLTVVNTAWNVIKTGGIDDLFVLGSSSCAINGDVTNAYIYGSALCNLNNDVQNLTLYSTESSFNLDMTVGCDGKVDTLVARNQNEEDYIYYTRYGFKTNTLSVVNGSLRTPEDQYSNEPVATAQQETAANSSDDDEYDDVPKTGQSSLFLWMFLASAACFAGSIALKRASR